MRGGPLHYLLRGAAFVGEVRTAPRYRFYSVEDRFPALEDITGPRREGGGGVSAAAASPAESEPVSVPVAGELYDVPWEVLRESLLPAEPQELELGVIELEDGTGALSMVRRRSYTEAEGACRDISQHADWRGYIAALARAGSALPAGPPLSSNAEEA